MPTLDELDATIRAALQADARVSHALAYGSRTQALNGQRLDDEFSDLEYYAYPRSGEGLDVRAFLEKLTPLLLYVVNDFGTPNAVTPELLRIELHAAQAGQMSDILAWPNSHADASAMPIKDPDGQLAHLLAQWTSGPVWTPGEAQTIYDQTLSWLVFASAVAGRGEYLRAAEVLTWVRGGLLRLARFALNLPHFPAATRLAENDLGNWARRISAVTGSEARATVQATTQAAALCRELAAELGLNSRDELLRQVNQRLQP